MTRIDMSTRAKIRVRLHSIEKNITRYLGEGRVSRIKEGIQKRLKLEKKPSASRTGIIKPTINSKDLFKEDTTD